MIAEQNFLNDLNIDVTEILIEILFLLKFYFKLLTLEGISIPETFTFISIRMNVENLIIMNLRFIFFSLVLCWYFIQFSFFNFSFRLDVFYYQVFLFTYFFWIKLSTLTKFKYRRTCGNASRRTFSFYNCCPYCIRRLDFDFLFSYKYFNQ